MSKLISVSQASKMLGVTVKTLKICTNVTCFSARLYGARGSKKLKKVIAELETKRGENNESNNKSNAN